MPNYQKQVQTGTDKGGNPIYAMQTKHFKKKNSGSKKRKGGKSASFEKAVDIEKLMIRKRG